LTLPKTRVPDQEHGFSAFTGNQQQNGANPNFLVTLNGWPDSRAVDNKAKTGSQQFLSGS
jgi:hypothetical protein